MTWKDNTLKVGGVEFTIWDEAVPTSDGVHHTFWLFTKYPIVSCEVTFDTEAEARAAAEEIVRQIFGEEIVYRKQVSGMYESLKTQRCIVVPLEEE